MEGMTNMASTKREATMKSIIGIVLFVMCAVTITCSFAEAQSAPKAEPPPQLS